MLKGSIDAEGNVVFGKSASRTDGADQRYNSDSIFVWFGNSLSFLLNNSNIYMNYPAWPCYALWLPWHTRTFYQTCIKLFISSSFFCSFQLTENISPPGYNYSAFFFADRILWAIVFKFSLCIQICSLIPIWGSFTPKRPTHDSWTLEGTSCFPSCFQI